MSIFREPFKDEIKNQLNHRQNMMTNYSSQNTQYFGSRNAWIRMTSSVNVNGSANLAKQYVLQGGTLASANSLRLGYSANNFSGNKNRLGIRPMPGINNIDIKSKSAYGSLREITVNFQCWDISQLEDLELLYMRPGYTVLVEWGWLPYITSGGAYNGSFSDFYGTKLLNMGATERTKIFKDLYDKCIKYEGNYDAMLGYVKNYSWKAREDGGYDCQTIIISTGEIIESLKVNYLNPNLVQLPMYTKPKSVGFGFLDSLFASQGTTPSYVYTDSYEKNILAGIWTELDNKLREVPLSNAGTFLNNSYAFPNFPGLSNIGDSNAMIVPGDPAQAYITLGSVVKIINDFAIIKGGKTGAQNDPLITLSTKYQEYTGGSLAGTPLLCTAHPLQISTDPTVCLIPNDTWANIILPAVASSTTALTATAQPIADAITNELAEAFDNSFWRFSTRSDNYDGDKYMTAIKKINSRILFELIDKNFTSNAYNGVDNGPYNSSNTYGQGLAGLLTQEFSGYDNSDWDLSTSPFKDPNIMHVFYLYTAYNVLKNIGIRSKINLKCIKAVGPFAINATCTYEQVLKDLNGSAITYTKDEVRKVLTNNSGPVPISRFGGVGYESYFEVENFIIEKDLNSSIDFLFDIGDAIEAMRQINISCTTPYFYKGDPNTELGVIENIYVNLDFLYKQSLSINLESQDSKEKNEINLYNYVKSIISGINSALGSVSNLELHVDPVDNVARIIDVNYTDPDKNPNLFELQVQNKKSVVRSYQLYSQIFPNQSSIIAIGAQGGKGGQMGIQNNTMIDFNKKLTDRIMPVKGEDLVSKATSLSSPDLGNYLCDIIVLLALLNQTSLSDNSAYFTASNKAKNSLRDAIVYFQNLVPSSAANRNIIPTKFSFEMDGIGGLTIGQLFTINQDILPDGYKGGKAGSKLAQIVTGIGHKIENGDWTTTIDALNVVLDTPTGGWNTITGLDAVIKEAIDRIISRYT